MRFCPQCGAAVVTGARFCVECGAGLAAAETAAASPAATAAPATATGATAPAAVTPRSRFSTTFVAAFAGILVVGLAVAAAILRHLPEHERQLATAEGRAGNLPPGHPEIQLPEEARTFIADTEHKARANPKDIAAWTRLGEVSTRAAALDPTYYAKADEAWAHVLKLDPDNLEALRGIGDRDYDRGRYDEAIAAYEHYLSKKPDDPDVRTDLGTMYLATGNADQAVVQYKKVLASHPDFFQAYFNMAVAYQRLGDPVKARASLEQALKFAPDDQTRGRIKQALGQSSAPPAPATNGASESQQAANGAGAPADTFEGAIERMLRGLPVAGPKVQTVQWPSKTEARVLMDNFPMDQMPPASAAKFVAHLKAGIRSVKASHKVAGQIEVDICDAASGRVMRAVKE